MSEFLEIIMILSFGLSWPMNVIKSYRARTAKGKSISFLLLIFFGYEEAYREYPELLTVIPVNSRGHHPHGLIGG